jgi:hypothetical protein
MSITAAEGGSRRSILLRTALAMPLLYVVLQSLRIHWALWSSPPGQARDFYLINGLLLGIPIAVMGLALVLLVVGTVNRILWVVVCVGGFAVAAYGLRYEFDGEIRLSADTAFGLYVALLGLWQLLSRRDPSRLPQSDSQA